MNPKAAERWKVKDETFSSSRYHGRYDSPTNKANNTVVYRYNSVEWSRQTGPLLLEIDKG